MLYISEVGLQFKVSAAQSVLAEVHTDSAVLELIPCRRSDNPWHSGYARQQATTAAPLSQCKQDTDFSLVSYRNGLEQQGSEANHT